jgi:hypothetical protein
MRILFADPFTCQPSNKHFVICSFDHRAPKWFVATMGVCRALLVALIALLSSSSQAAVSALTPPGPAVLGITFTSSHRSPVTAGRSLRGTTSTDEERNIFATLVSRAKTTYWIETGHSSKDVKKVLKLENLSGAALKAAPNFKLYDDFVQALEGRKLNRWLSEGLSTQQVWAAYKLDDIPAAQLKESDKYKTFVRYAKMEDDKIFKLKSNDADVKIDFSNGPTEMAVKMDIWVAAERPTWYVKKVLNLDSRGIKSFRSSKNYPYYEEYLRRVQEAKAARVP